MSKINKDFLECVQEVIFEVWKLKNVLITSLLITSPIVDVRITEKMYWS
jgi:hypothetical protein